MLGADARSMTITACSTIAPRSRRSSRGEDHLPARRHDVLDDREPPPVDLAALGEPARAVGLRLLAHEERREAGELRQHRRDRDPTELEPGEHLGAVGHERHERLGDRRGAAPGSDSKRYLSKYSLLTAPERSTNSPVRCVRS